MGDAGCRLAAAASGVSCKAELQRVGRPCSASRRLLLLGGRHEGRLREQERAD